MSSFGVRASRDFSSESDNEARTRENSRKRFLDNSQKDPFQVESFLWFALFAAFIYFGTRRVVFPGRQHGANSSRSLQGSEDTEVAERKGTLERLSALSDNVFSIIITIIVLELNPPDHPIFAALLPLWPTVVSYVVSYLFVAIVWLNHHHVLQYAEVSSPRLIRRNFAHLFSVSLVPFSTA